MHRTRNYDAARFGDALDASGNVDAITHEVVALHDYIAKVNADAQRQWWTRVLDFDRAGHCLYRAGELHQEAVAHCLEQPS